MGRSIKGSTDPSQERTVVLAMKRYFPTLSPKVELHHIVIPRKKFFFFKYEMMRYLIF